MNEPTTSHTMLIGKEENGCRADRIIRKKFQSMPLSSVYMLFRKGKVLVSGKKIAQNYRLSEGDTLEITTSPIAMTPLDKTPEAVNERIINSSFFKENFKVLFEDSDILACNKPSGLVVHPGTGHVRHDSLIDLATAYLNHTKCIPEGDETALVHRLDRDTSGIILIAKNKRTLRPLHDTFRERSIFKEYRAICHHRPPEYEGKITLQLSRTHQRNRGMKMRVDREGAMAESSYQILSFANDVSNVAIVLETGKTHQIRVQMSHVGAPVVGDVRYGDPAKDAVLLEGKLHRLYLHAYRLKFPHPHTRKTLSLEAPLPAEFRELCNR